MAQEEKREVLDAEGAAELLGLAPEGVRHLARQKKIPGRKVGREWRFSRSKLLSWIAGEDQEEDEK